MSYELLVYSVLNSESHLAPIFGKGVLCDSSIEHSLVNELKYLLYTTGYQYFPPW